MGCLAFSLQVSAVGSHETGAALKQSNHTCSHQGRQCLAACFIKVEYSRHVCKKALINAGLSLVLPLMLQRLVALLLDEKMLVGF